MMFCASALMSSGSMVCGDGGLDGEGVGGGGEGGVGELVGGGLLALGGGEGVDDGVLEGFEVEVSALVSVAGTRRGARSGWARRRESSAEGRGSLPQACSVASAAGGVVPACACARGH